MMGRSQAFSGTLPFGRGPMMHGWGYSEPFTGAAPFGPGMMQGWGYGQPFTSTVPFGPGVMMAPGGVHEQVWTAVAKELDLTYLGPQGQGNAPQGFGLRGGHGPGMMRQWTW